MSDPGGGTGVRAALVVAVGVAAVDWLTKALAAATLDDGPVDLGGLLTLRLSHNPGVAFGVGDRLPGGVVIAVTAVVTLLLAVMVLRGALRPFWAAGLVLGGAVANLGDRAVGGSVVDFLDLGWWPSFNLADALLCAGCAFLLIASARAPAEDRSGAEATARP